MRSERSWPSRKEIEVLKILQRVGKPMIGMDIAKSSGGVIDRAAVYVYLGRLRVKGFVTVKRLEGADYPGRPQPIYRINGLGRKAIAAADFMRSAASTMPA